MLSNFTYPVLCTKKYAQTVNYFEDHFDYAPEFELPNFSILKRKGHDNNYIAIIDDNHEQIPEEFRGSTKGVILTYPVDNINTTYQQLYWEGLNILSEPVEAICKETKHFYVVDPNGILIDIVENPKIRDYSANKSRGQKQDGHRAGRQGKSFAHKAAAHRQ